MCVSKVNRNQVQDLPANEREALLTFAMERRDKAVGDHAKMYWNSLVESCISDGELEGLMEARREAYETSGKEASINVVYVR